MGKPKVIRMVKINSKGKPVGRAATYVMADVTGAKAPSKKKAVKKKKPKKKTKKRKRRS